jgi:hypothetical protein
MYHQNGTIEHPDPPPRPKEGTVGKTELPNFDIRNEPHVIITDLYHRKSGKHLRSTMSTEDGTIIEESGPCPSKDTVFLPAYKRAAWDRFVDSINLEKVSS